MMRISELEKWDRRYLALASTVGAWSKGPRKRIGAVIVRPDRSVASMGYNGPPRGYDDVAFLAMTRDEQHDVVIHAERNAIRQMQFDERHSPKRGYTIYVSPLYPCRDCAQSIIDWGFKRVVAYCGHASDDWAESAKDAQKLFVDNDVECLFIKD